MINLLVLTSDDESQDSPDIHDIRELLASWLGLETEKLNLVLSSKWVETQFPRSGSWDSWIRDSVLGIDYATRKPFFLGFVALDEKVGRANGGILSLALLRGKVTLLVREREVSIIKSVHAAADQHYRIEV